MTVLSFPTAYAPVRASQPRLRITRRGRIVLGVVIALAVASLALIVGIGAPGAVATRDAGAPLSTYVVGGGESLWDIAAQVAPEADPREFAAEVKQVNRLSSSVLQPGQELLIPARYAG